MQPKCITAVNAAAGRTLSQAEIRAIDERINGTAKMLARQDRAAWLSMTPTQRTLAAAERALQDAKAENRLNLERKQLQLVKAADVGAEVRALQDAYGSKRASALTRHLEQTDAYIKGVKDQYWSQLRELFDAALSSDGMSAGRRALQFLFDVENTKMTRDLAVEIFARGQGGTGNKLAVQAAKAWGTTVETMRQRFNNAGGDIGRLEYGYLPQASDQGRVLAAGKDAWIAKTLPLLDRSRYVQPDGRVMNDAEVAEFLGATWETLSSGGLNKLEPGANRGSGARANRGSDARQLHWKDGQAYVEYMSEFGAGSMYDAMTSHISGLARDIGLVERYGPNPEHQFRVQDDIAKQQDGQDRRVVDVPQAYWNVLSGKAGAVQNASLARVAADVRNINVASKLGRAVWASISDLPTYFVTVGYNKLPYWQALKNIGAQFDGNTRDFLTAHGLIAESLVSDLNRFSGDHIRNNWSGKIANSVMKLSFMNAWTDSMRRAFQMTMMGGLGKVAGKSWGALTEWDRSHLGRKGITKDDWDIITQAQPTEYRGQKYLTPEAIMQTGAINAEQLVSKVLGLIRDESEYAVINPDLAARAAQTWGGQQAGTVGGELARSVMQFKSFPIAMVSRHWRRFMNIPRGLDGAPVAANRLNYAVPMLMVGTTIAGGIAFQIKEILSGRDPVPVNSVRFWTEAMLQGGGLSIVGDLLFQDPRESPGGFGANLLSNVAGPTMGTFGDIVGLGAENAWRAASGDDLNLGAGAARTIRGTLPYQNLWWLSGAIDHSFFHALQENLSPGYLSRVERRAARQHDQDYWWQMGPGLPERGPDLSRLWSD